ncbi:MAG: hypothetical protein ACRD3Q_13510 [Terriglobales bacterium]
MAIRADCVGVDLGSGHPGDTPGVEMKREQFICDECGAERKEVNHWFAIQLTHGSERGQMNPGIEIVRWGCARPEVRQFHFCGQACVHAAVDRFMSSGEVQKQIADGQSR